jgi:hypothetical protein
VGPAQQQGCAAIYAAARRRAPTWQWDCAGLLLIVAQSRLRVDRGSVGAAGIAVWWTSTASPGMNQKLESLGIQIPSLISGRYAALNRCGVRLVCGAC